MDAGKSYHWFVFHDELLLVEKKDDQYKVPEGSEPPVPVSYIQEVICPGNRNCRAAVITDLSLRLQDKYILVTLRDVWDLLDIEWYNIAGKASQVLYWDKHSRFCPACAAPTDQTTPITKVCPSCGFELYPVISVAILALVRKDDQVLLVQAKNFRGPFHGLVAGFLEAGETLEECVAREVKEETGLTTTNITYFANQPWPYPSGLMVGFIADYLEGEITIQEDELKSAAFYGRDNLPELPRRLSLARKMVDWWVGQE